MLLEHSPLNREEFCKVLPQEQYQPISQYSGTTGRQIWLVVLTEPKNRFFGNLHYFYKFFVMTCVCTEGNKNNNKNNNTNDDQDKKGNDNDEDDNDKDDNSRQRGCVHDDNNDPTIMAIMPSIICCKKWMKNVMR